MNIRNRVKELRRVAACDLRPNPKNWRLHPESQQNALRKMLAEIGMANACVARELPDGSLMLLDGHLRAETMASSLIPVIVLDVSEEEGDKILATLDPIAGMAKTNHEAFAALSEGFEEISQRLKEINEAERTVEIPPDDPQHTEPAVRMVQLFFDQDNIEEFHQLADRLSAEYGTEGVTSTVLEAVKMEAGK